MASLKLRDKKKKKEKKPSAEDRKVAVIRDVCYY
jgi:hypothetical protein